LSDFFMASAILLLAGVAAGLWRVWRGPTAADRMMAAQLIGTGGVGVVLLLAAAGPHWGMLDAALVLALLAAFAAVAFVKARTRHGVGDPETEPDTETEDKEAGTTPNG